MTNEPEEIICRTTPWYKKRRLLMVAMLLGFSAYFFYDWKIGYPKQQQEYNAYWPVYQELSVKNKDDKGWLAKAKVAAWLVLRGSTTAWQVSSLKQVHPEGYSGPPHSAAVPEAELGPNS